MFAYRKVSLLTGLHTESAEKKEELAGLLILGSLTAMHGYSLEVGTEDKSAVDADLGTRRRLQVLIVNRQSVFSTLLLLSDESYYEAHQDTIPWLGCSPKTQIPVRH